MFKCTDGREVVIEIVDKIVWKYEGYKGYHSLII